MTRKSPRRWRPDPEPLRWPIAWLLAPLLAWWAIALLVTLTIPSLHTGERSWWPWCCVAGLVLGGLGYVYVRRGRGNASGV
ncbi:hypothetical protein KEM60_01738 [Austwickia sp. TVS 96-490-7B]|uniref:DUF2530 domain-containing protein n=1 Tax=Austwickia sp. TVS 96-490-7B TaxID=2830843 RepID=UPI001C559B2E|nr:DUF2530 domain-containing protein [Austwickia sp. TVS 96-490-7B]MBW3085538.1 hypothetical protein [Austwickia sp. TVS 96-490-7B]